MEVIFHITKWLTHRPNNVLVNVHKTAKYGDKSLRTIGPHIWNSLPEHVKVETNFIKFREYITSGSDQFASIICVSILTSKCVNHMIATLDLIHSLKTVLNFLFLVFSVNIDFI